MNLTVWDIKVSGKKEQFATTTADVEEVINLYKEHFIKKYNKAFNFDSLERVTWLEVLSKEGQENE